MDDDKTHSVPATSCPQQSWVREMARVGTSKYVMVTTEDCFLHVIKCIQSKEGGGYSKTVSISQFILPNQDSRKPLPVSPPSTYTFRSLTCSQLTKGGVGKSAKPCGWLTFKSMHGTFMVLRDSYGVTQVYVPKEVFLSIYSI